MVQGLFFASMVLLSFGGGVLIARLAGRLVRRPAVGIIATAMIVLGIGGLVTTLKLGGGDIKHQTTRDMCAQEEPQGACRIDKKAASYINGYSDGFSASTNYYRIWGYTGDRDERSCNNIVKAGNTAVVLVIGQSNAANTGPTPFTPSSGVFNYNYQDRKCYVARDPLLGAQGQAGSVWSRLGDRLVKDGVYDSVIFAPFVVGSTSVKNWGQGILAPALAQMVRDFHSTELKFTHVLWHQGEADRGISRQDYAGNFERIVSSLHDNDVDAPIWMSVGTICWFGKGGIPHKAIHQAQQDIVEKREDVLAGPNTDKYDRIADRHDGCHFSDLTMERVADEWLDLLKNYETTR